MPHGAGNTSGNGTGSGNGSGSGSSGSGSGGEGEVTIGWGESGSNVTGAPGSQWSGGGNGSGGGWGNGSSGGGGGGGSGGGWFEFGHGFGFHVPGPEEIMFGFGRAVADLFFQAYIWFLEMFNKYGLGTPYPVNSGAMEILGQPTGEFQSQYNGILGDIIFPLIPPIFGSIVVVGAILWATGGRRRQQQGADMVWDAVIGMFVAMLSWAYVTLLHRFTHELTMFIAPSAAELTGDMGSLVKTLTGQVVALAGIAIIGWAEGLGLVLMYGSRQGFLWVGPALFVTMVLIWVFIPSRIVQMAMVMGVSVYHSIVFWTLPTAFGFRVAHSLQWSFSAHGVWNAIIMMGVMAGALFYPLVITGSFILAPIALAFSSRAQTAVETLKGKYDRYGNASGSGSDSDPGPDDAAGSGGGGGQSWPDRHERNQWDLGSRVAMADGGATASSGGQSQGLSRGSVGSRPSIRQADSPASAQSSADASAEARPHSPDSGSGSGAGMAGSIREDFEIHEHESSSIDVDRQWQDRERAHREWSQ